MRIGVVVSCVVATLLASSGPARAADPNAARTHFEAGKKLRDDGDCARAIPEFVKSLEAEKSIGALYNLGFCHEQQGRRPDAYEAYKQAQLLASAKKDDRLREISGAIAALLETPHIRVVLPQPLPDGIKLTVDGALVPEALYATDASETVVFTKRAQAHEVSVVAPGYEETHERVDTKQLKAIVLRRPSARPPPDATPPIAPATPQRAGGWVWQHWTGLGVTVVGAGFVTVASVVLISNVIREEDALTEATRVRGTPACTGGKGNCPANDTYNEAQAKTKRDVPLVTAAGIGGLLAVGGGLVLFLTAPSTSSEAKIKSDASRLRFAPIFGTTTRGVSLSGTF